MDWILLLTAVLALAASVSAVASAVIARTTIRAMRVQDMNARTALSITLLQQLITTYHSEDMRKDRRAAARTLLPVLRARETSQGLQGLVNVLNFFDRVGAMVERGALDEYYAYLEFEIPICGYWRAARDHRLVQEARQENPGYYQYIEALYERVLVLDYQENIELAGSRPKRSYNDAEWEEWTKAFLEGEAGL